jgi:hypothetical protein
MKELGITVVKEIDKDFTGRLQSWLNFGFPPNIYYPDITAKIIEELMLKHAGNKHPQHWTGGHALSV